jgi:hypothetical protein
LYKGYNQGTIIFASISVYHTQNCRWTWPFGPCVMDRWGSERTWVGTGEFSAIWCSSFQQKFSVIVWATIIDDYLTKSYVAANLSGTWYTISSREQVLFYWSIYPLIFVMACGFRTTVPPHPHHFLLRVCNKLNTYVLDTWLSCRIQSSGLHILLTLTYLIIVWRCIEEILVWRQVRISPP